MAYEATLMIETELPINFTCSNTSGIEKGSLLKLSDPMTAAVVTADNDTIAGIAAAEKIANDGQTKIPVYRCGIFKGYASGSITAGDALAIEGDTINTLRSVNGLSAANLSGSKVWGIALETCTTGETFLFELRPGFWAGSAV